MPFVTVSHVLVTKAKKIACNHFGNGRHQLGSSSSLVPSPSWIREAGHSGTPRGAPEPLGYVRVQL